jgi:hypothetical protein
VTPPANGDLAALTLPGSAPGYRPRHINILPSRILPPIYREWIDRGLDTACTNCSPMPFFLTFSGPVHKKRKT